MGRIAVTDLARERAHSSKGAPYSSNVARPILSTTPKNPKRTAVIFRYELLPPSETFIRSQASALTDFRPCYAGFERIPNGLSLPDSVVVMRDRHLASRIKGQLFLHTGWAPDFYRQLLISSPAVLHAHFAPDAAVALPIASQLHLPLVVTLHGYDVTSSEEHLRKRLTGRLFFRRRHTLFRRTAVFLCISEFIRRSALAAGYPETKLRVHYIGVDRKLFRPQSARRQRGLILFVGRLIEQKGCRYLIQAMRLVVERYPAAELTIVGDGPSNADLQCLARDLGIPCRFLGAQTSTTVREWLARAWVFCAPSVTGANGAQEGLGTVFTEAQAMGLPVVSFRTGGIPEIVHHEETGLLAPERDVRTLGEYIVRYLTDEKFWHACSQRAAARIEQQFDLERQTHELENIYRSVSGTVQE